MPLPKIEHPVIEIHLKSLDRKVKFRPFLVKEEKILLIAKESKDIDEIRSSIMHIIQNCCLESIDVGLLPLFDIEMAFLKLRAKSVGETVKLEYLCRNLVGEGEEKHECGGRTNYSINLENVVFETPEGHNDKVMLTDTIGLKLRYPNLEIDFNADEDEDEYTTMLRLLIENIDYVFDDVSIYKIEDMEKNELLEYIQNITVESLENMRTFFKSSPRVILRDTIVCNQCGFNHEFVTEELLSFFI